MKRKLSALLLSSLLLFSACTMLGQKTRFGTAGEGGIYHTFGTAFAAILTKEGVAAPFDVKTTAGSAANLRLLSEQYLQLAISQTDLANDAYYGTGTFADSGSYQGYRAVAGLYTETCQIVTLASSNITSVGDLQGKKVSIGETESGTEQNAKQILQAYGLSAEMVEEVNLNYTDAAAQLESGTIDAFFCTVGAPTTVISDLAKEQDIRLLPIDEEESKRLLSAYGFYTSSTISAGTYPGQDRDIATLGVKAVLLASEKLPSDTVQRLTEALFAHQEELQEALPITLSLDEQTAVAGITIPFHAGAAAYYKTQSITVKTEAKG